tara:strand:+ start:100 stop:897 length:798 start_codon:yes stop_codon:yes gene_type:complete
MPERDLYGGSDRMYADDYNIGRFGEFDRFQDERSVAPEMFERPQSTIGGYDEQGYTLPASEPNNWWWGYSRPGDVVEQERGVYPFVKRHAPKWSKDIYRDIKGGWEGSSLNPNINPRGMNQGLPEILMAKGVTYRDPIEEKYMQELQKKQGHVWTGVGKDTPLTTTRDEWDLELRYDTLNDKGQNLYDLYLNDNPDVDKEKLMNTLQRDYTDEYKKKETEDWYGVDIAAIDPSDWRSIVKIIQAGGNPDDYIEKKANRGGLMSFV